MSDLQFALPDLTGSVIEDISAANLTLPRLEYRRAALRQRLQPVGEHLYPCASGNLYAARSYARSIKACSSVAIYVTLNDDAVDIRLTHARHAIKAAVVMPLVTRTVTHHGSGFVCALLHPTHPSYRQFSTAPVGKMKELDRNAFAPLNESLRAVCSGSLDSNSGRALLAQIVAVATMDLPVPAPLDARVAATIERLHHDANLPLEWLAADVGLSCFRLSQLFSKHIGLSLRSYQLWMKADRT